MLLETELDAALLQYETYGTEADLWQKQAQLFELKLKLQEQNLRKISFKDKFSGDQLRILATPFIK